MEPNSVHFFYLLLVFILSFAFYLLSFVQNFPVEHLFSQCHPVEVHSRHVVGRCEIGSVVDAGLNLAVEDRLYEASGHIVEVNYCFCIDR